MFHTVIPHLEEGKRTLVYILAQVDRIGHATMEPFFLKTLFASQYDRIILMTRQGDGPGYNPFVLKCLGRNLHVTTADSILPMLGFLDGDMHDLTLFDLYLASPQRITRDFGRHMTAGGTFRFFELTDSIRQIGKAFLENLGMPADKRFVVLHVRDMTYMPEKAHHAFRCADIGTYADAIRRFVDAGYWVFRLGDSGSVPLEDLPEQVVDLPHHPDYSQALDVFLCAECAFAFNQASGPEALVRAFGRPAATANLVYELSRLPMKDDLLLFKHYASSADGAPLSYAKILERGLHDMSDGEDLEAQGVLIHENSAEELDDLAKIMIERDRSGVMTYPDTDRLALFRSLAQKYEQTLRADPARVQENMDFYAYAHDFGRPAPSVLDRKGYLGGD